MPCYDSRSGDCSDYIERLNKATQAACEMAKLLTQSQKDRISGATLAWIKEHDELDRKRIAEQKESLERFQVRRAVLAKLTPRERIILGLKEQD